MQHALVTLTTNGTAYSLLTLMKAAVAGYRDVGTRVILQSAKGNTGDIFIGTSGVTTSAYGHTLLAAGDSVELVVSGLNGLYAVSDTNAQGLAILIVGP